MYVHTVWFGYHPCVQQQSLHQPSLLHVLGGVQAVTPQIEIVCIAESSAKFWVFWYLNAASLQQTVSESRQTDTRRWIRSRTLTRSSSPSLANNHALIITGWTEHQMLHTRGGGRGGEKLHQTSTISGCRVDGGSIWTHQEPTSSSCRPEQ